MWSNIIVKIVVIVIALIIIATYLTPLLTGFFPPFGAIILILLYLGLIAYAFGWTPLP